MTKAEPFVWSVSSYTHQDETHSGDKCVVSSFAGGTLVAVIDALGHGDQAAHTAEVAATTLERHLHRSPAELLERCHTELRATRGAAISLASFDWRRRVMTWLGIGNVAGVLVQPDGAGHQIASLLVRGGVVGDRLPELQTLVVPLVAEATLIMTTDGVHGDFTEVLSVTREPRHLAQRILDGYARRDDDATVLVFHCIGDSAWT